MTFGESVQAVFRKYAEFEGRASRPEFWWWALFHLLVTSALGVFGVIPVGDGGSVGGILTGIWSIGVLLPSLAVAVRRLRDAGDHWGHIFWLLLPVAGLVVLIVLWAKPTRA